MEDDAKTEAQLQQGVPRPENLPYVKKVLLQLKEFQETGEVVLPKDYVATNAIKSALVILSQTKGKDGKMALQSCTQESIYQSLLSMVLQGLSPMKKQCSFIVYGNDLQYQREYAGNYVLAQRYGNMKWMKANAVFKGDKVVIETDENGRKKLIKHESSSFDSDQTEAREVIGAYAIWELADGTKDLEEMDIFQIRNAWNQRRGEGLSQAHKNFPDQMAKKTIINRSTKMLINASTDSNLIVGGNDDDLDNDQVLDLDKLNASKSEAVKQTIREKGNAVDLPTKEKATVQARATGPIKDRPGTQDVDFVDESHVAAAETAQAGDALEFPDEEDF